MENLGGSGDVPEPVVQMEEAVPPTEQQDVEQQRLHAYLTYLGDAQRAVDSAREKDAQARRDLDNANAVIAAAEADLAKLEGRE